MANVAQFDANAKPENLYKKTTDRGLQKKLAERVIAAYSPKVAAAARALLKRRPEHWAEAEQAGKVGLLEALSLFDPDRGAGFWTFAYRHVHEAIRNWVARGVFWRKDWNRAKARSSEKTNVHRTLGVVSLDLLIDQTESDESASPFAGKVFRSISPPNPEELAIEREKLSPALSFIAQLPEEDLDALDEDGRRILSCRHKGLVAQARAAFGGRTW